MLAPKLIIIVVHFLFGITLTSEAGINNSRIVITKDCNTANLQPGSLSFSLIDNGNFTFSKPLAGMIIGPTQFEKLELTGNPTGWGLYTGNIQNHFSEISSYSFPKRENHNKWKFLWTSRVVNFLGIIHKCSFEPENSNALSTNLIKPQEIGGIINAIKME